MFNNYVIAIKVAIEKWRLTRARQCKHALNLTCESFFNSFFHSSWGFFPEEFFQFLRDSTPCRSKESPLSTILTYPFLVTGPKIFLKAPLVQIYYFIRGSTRQRNPSFWLKLSKNCLKTPFLACFFFKMLPAAQEIWPK